MRNKPMNLLAFLLYCTHSKLPKVLEKISSWYFLFLFIFCSYILFLFQHTFGHLRTWKEKNCSNSFYLFNFVEMGWYSRSDICCQFRTFIFVFWKICVPKLWRRIKKPKEREREGKKKLFYSTTKKVTLLFSMFLAISFGILTPN